MTPQPKPTMADVARAANVSPTTVSHALNGKGRVDPATRKRVRDAAEKLGYWPSRAARNLALGSSGTVGLLLPGRPMPLTELLATDWYGRVAVAAGQALLSYDRVMTLVPPDADANDLRRLGLEGAIVLDPVAADPRKPALIETGLPHVFVGRDPDDPRAPSVAPDTAGGIRGLLDHLRGQGAKRIHLLATDVTWPDGDEALATYHAWSQQHGMPETVTVAPVAAAESRAKVVEAARAAALEALTETERPDAILGLFDGFGRGIIAAATDLDLTVPDDLLVAQDIDGIYAQLQAPPLTAFDRHPDEQIVAAVAQLIDLPHDGANSQVTTRVTLRIRESTLRHGSGKTSSRAPTSR